MYLVPVIFNGLWNCIFWFVICWFCKFLKYYCSNMYNFLQCSLLFFSWYHEMAVIPLFAIYIFPYISIQSSSLCLFGLISTDSSLSSFILSSPVFLKLWVWPSRSFCPTPTMDVSSVYILSCHPVEVSSPTLTHHICSKLSPCTVGKRVSCPLPSSLRCYLFPHRIEGIEV